MKAKPYSSEQVQEFEGMTKGLSIAGKGVWIATRMILAARKEYAFDGPPEALGWLIGCPPDILRTVLKEFELQPCGFRVEWPPGNAAVTEMLRLVFEPDEKIALFSSSESLRVQIAREDKKKKEIIPIPEHYELSEKNKEFGARYGMTTDTLRHEFEKFKTRHAESRFTAAGWDSLAWRTWVLNWVSYGRIQVMVNGNGQTVKPPPFPPKNDPIARNGWRRAYGDPKQYGYSE